MGRTDADVCGITAGEGSGKSIVAGQSDFAVAGTLGDFDLIADSEYPQTDASRSIVVVPTCGFRTTWTDRSAVCGTGCGEVAGAGVVVGAGIATIIGASCGAAGLGSVRQVSRRRTRPAAAGIATIAGAGSAGTVIMGSSDLPNKRFHQGALGGATV